MRFFVDLKAYAYPDGTVALSDIRFQVARGEFCGILGSNGSGKTTLLKIMDGLIREYDGSVLLDGRDVRSLQPKDIYRTVGLVFQNPDDQLFAHTVFEDVAFGPRNMGFAEAEVKARVERALDAVDLAGAAAKQIHHLSYGQKKRACIAGLLAMGHEVLLMDEPTAGLDPMGEYRMMELLTRLNRQEGVTIVMATHSVDLVPLFLHRLHILSRGRIVRGGPPEEVFTAPAEMESVKLRLPHIAELIHRLKHEDGVPFRRTPLTIGEARREIMELIETTRS
ncbi:MULTISPECIES: energy-coupling factor ABC transporter ATP-binding protein [Geobacter]|uniref:energy-coupling factor ABC transporter ATP-binding protein n=1 Tax=Geobacter TaxID=28231 RepID=UPI002573AF84|nr:ATP-binding cassette domain-containing protein [Geobacter sulfurreducens]BEH11528.1 ATP-binding cassette domain-containing protein [Geobacter sulfurreducens subsp. ethanolicus]BET59384.1 ATP-binding cassette domain-containing protein [Geobacter sp. 60473]